MEAEQARKAARAGSLRSALVAAAALVLLGPLGARAEVLFQSISGVRNTVHTRMTQGTGNDLQTELAPGFAPFHSELQSLNTCPDGGVASSRAQLETEGSQSFLRVAGSIDGRFDFGQCGGFANAHSGTAGNNSLIGFRVDVPTHVVVRTSLDAVSSGAISPGTGLADFRSRVRLRDLTGGTIDLLEHFNDAQVVEEFILQPSGNYEVRAEAEMTLTPAASYTYAASFDLEIEFDPRTCDGELEPCPEYDPVAWNDLDLRDNDPPIRGYDNCYNYALDRMEGRATDPGQRAKLPLPIGATSPFLTCPEVGDLAVEDGLNRVCDDSPEAGQLCETGSIADLEGYCRAENACLTYLVVDPGPCLPGFLVSESSVYLMETIDPDKTFFRGCDYHWYRLDRGGTWSHKPGWLAPRLRDVANDLISDPRLADHGTYTGECGFFCVPCDLADDPMPSPTAGASAPATTSSLLRLTYVRNAGLSNPTGAIARPADIADIESRLTGLTPTADPAFTLNLGEPSLLLVPVGLPSFPGGETGYVRIARGVVEVSDGSVSSFYLDETDLESDLRSLFETATVPSTSQHAIWALAGLLGLLGLLIGRRSRRRV